jgi:hypothetical protein
MIAIFMTGSFVWDIGGLAGDTATVNRTGSLRLQNRRAARVNRQSRTEQGPGEGRVAGMCGACCRDRRIFLLQPSANFPIPPPMKPVRA